MRKTTSFLGSPFCYIKRSLYQDRLGTNKVKVETKVVCCPSGKDLSRCEGYCFWNSSDALFYRDEHYVESTIYW